MSPVPDQELSMKTKAPYTETLYAEPAPWPDGGTSAPNLRIRIEGLVQIGQDEFELSGVKPRNIDWPALMAALGPDVDETYADAISEAVWDCDILAVLRKRVKRA